MKSSLLNWLITFAYIFTNLNVIILSGYIILYEILLVIFRCHVFNVCFGQWTTFGKTRITAIENFNFHIRGNVFNYVLKIFRLWYVSARSWRLPSVRYISPNMNTCYIKMYQIFCYVFDWLGHVSFSRCCVAGLVVLRGNIYIYFRWVEQYANISSLSIFHLQYSFNCYYFCILYHN